MRNFVLRTPLPRKPIIDLSYEEKLQLNTIIDLLIPSDENFPPPSSLHLIDELLLYLRPGIENTATHMLSLKRLRAVLRELNLLADGRFCSANLDKQLLLLKHLERREPAVFQTLWTLVNHSYYTHLATKRYMPLV